LHALKLKPDILTHRFREGSELCARVAEKLNLLHAYISFDIIRLAAAKRQK